MAVYSTINPATGRTLATFDEISDSALQSIIASSEEAYHSWRTRETTDRKTILARIAQQHRDSSEELANLITMEMGKPVAQARGEVELSAQIYQYYADNLDELLAEEHLEIS